MRRFFYNQMDTLKVGGQLPVTDGIFNHWCKVLRASVGDKAVFFDGQGGEYAVTLLDVNKKSATVSVDDFNPINRNLPFDVKIALVMSRGERMDYAIQKACEAGVGSIQLLTSQFSEVRLKTEQTAKKMEHWQGVAISACEQCGLNLVPTILPPMDIKEFVQSTKDNAIKIVLSVPERLSGDKIFGYDKFDKNANYWLLIGAEGGLSDDELRLAYEHYFLAWQIGERVLRTETAPVVALASLMAFASI